MLRSGVGRLLEISPLLLMLPLVFYTLSDDTGRHSMDSLLLQTPAKGFLTGGYEHYPAWLNDEDVTIQRMIFTDENGTEHLGTKIEIRKELVLATPEDTGSMQPMFGAGNILVQEVVDEETELHDGDIIVYENDSMLIIHQIIGRQDGCYIAKGMNNYFPDPVCITKDRIKYRLLFAIPTN